MFIFPFCCSLNPASFLRSDAGDPTSSGYPEDGAKGAGEIENLRQHIMSETDQYAEHMRRQGFYAEVVTDIGTDIIEKADEMAAYISKRFPQAVFFGGQLVFPKESWLTRLLHNFIVFALQRQIFRQGIPFLVVPIRV